MRESDDVVLQLRRRASQGVSATDLATWLKEHIGEEFSVFDFVCYFGSAFRVPLALLRTAENWVGFNYQGHISDAEFNEMIDPYVRRYDAPS
jgi:hypothetical protein